MIMHYDLYFFSGHGDGDCGGGIDMRLMRYMDEGEKGTPIEMANAIIRVYMDSAECIKTEDALDESYRNLAEIAEHIQTYVKYNRNPVIKFMEE